MADPNPETQFWMCPNCGQVHFGEHPPDMCDYCQDYTTWKPLDEDSDEAKIIGDAQNYNQRIKQKSSLKREDENQQEQ